MYNLDSFFNSLNNNQPNLLYNIENIFKKPQNILILSTQKELHGRESFIRSFKNKNIFFVNEKENYDKCDIVMSLGYGSLVKYSEEVIQLQDKKFVFLEAGFLRSVVMDKSNSIFDKSTCFFVDYLGHHYDNNVHSRIEKLLNDKNFKITDREKQRAQNIINLIIGNKLTKYNDQDILEEFNIGNPNNPKILVVEQAKKDWSVIRGNGNDNSFQQMLCQAIIDNPDHDILVKLHPDTLNGKRGGLGRSYFGNLQNSKNLYVIKEKINPYTLLEKCDKTYVFSSMLGFESLMLGKETHVFGTPCYAGWGLTKDYQNINYRTCSRSILELVCAIYTIYTRYIDSSGKLIQVEDAISDLLEKSRLFHSYI
jgi:capsular polysaccharide export protein